MDFWAEGVEGIARRVRAREVSAREVTAHALDRIERDNPELNAFVACAPERALAEAAAIDDRLARGDGVGPLAGIPIGVKDLEHAAAFVTSFGSALHADDPPAIADSEQVARLRAAGCVVLGKTNTPEHGYMADTVNPHFGATRNPWALDRSPGGSSGGTASALAAGLVPLATGSDGGGSIRIPSALCGLSGLKPSQGRVPNGGARAPGSGLLGVKGPMARRVRDVALALDAVVGPDPLDPFSLPSTAGSWRDALGEPGSLAPPERVVWAPTMGWDVDAEIAAVTASAVRVLEGLGTEVVEVDEVFTEDPTGAFFTLWTIHRLHAQGRYRGTGDWERIDPGLRWQIEHALALGPTDYAVALDGCYRAHADLARTLERAPLLLCPTVAGQTPRCGEQGTIDGEATPLWVRFTYPFNLSRNPAGSVCAGFTGDHMPVGLQVVGRAHDDLGVLRAVAVLEDALALDLAPPDPVAPRPSAPPDA